MWSWARVRGTGGAGFCGGGSRRQTALQTQYALLRNAVCQGRANRPSLGRMAIAFARARYISRSTGGSAVRSAAYNAREGITDGRTGEVFSFKHRDAPEHHEVLLPEGADAGFADAATLWNAAEAAERRKDAQVARELVIALPADRDLSDEDRLELARSFARAHFTSRGLAVQLDIHAPHAGDAESERANHHAHLLVTTRRIEGDRLSPKKARDLDPAVRSVGGRAAVTEGEPWGALWREHQNRYFAAHGLELRVDATGAVPAPHVGPVRMRAPDSEAVAKAEAVARENAATARDPDTVLAVLTRNNATFSERDLDRHLSKHIPDEAEHLRVKAAVLGHADVLALHDRETGAFSGRYTTQVVRDQERAALTEAGALAASRRHRGIGEGARNDALETRTLRADQRAAFDHATAAGGLKLIEGRAGTGKSYTLAAVRDAHSQAGYRAIGLAPTNSVAQDLKGDGFTEAATVHSELFRLKNGRTTWNARTLVVVDEAAMLDSRVTGELLAEAKRSGAKLILAGDDRQLASIERGGLFTELRQRHGSAEITEVVRQTVDWQRQAARDMAEGRVEPALTAFARAGAITWTDKQDEAQARLVERWKADTTADPQSSRFVFAYTNRDVDALNAALRAVRRERGELGEDVRLQTKHGEADFAVGDRVQFTDTLRAAKIYNGNAGAITAIDARTGVVRATLDGPAGQGREVTWRAGEFAGFRHGYAGTIYKGQGKTLDHTYLLHSHHWRQASSYVALTRQRESARIFAAVETARDVRQLARQMSRGEVRAASVAWAVRDELPAALRARSERAEAAEDASEATAEGRTKAARPRDAAPPPSGTESPISPRSAVAGPTPERAAEPGWLIAPRVTTAPIEAGAVAAAVAADPDVRREREALGHYLAGAYRDPRQARVRLDELVKMHGHTSVAQRIAADPGQLGERRGKTSLFAGSAARQDRATAERVMGAIGPAVSRMGEAETAAAQGYRANVEAQRRAEATGIPSLSERAQAAIGADAAAKDEAGRAQVWKAVRADRHLAGELDEFMRAVERRFGAEGLRALDRSGMIEGARVEQDERVALTEIGRTVQAVRRSERAASTETRWLTASQRVGQGTRFKP